MSTNISGKTRNSRLCDKKQQRTHTEDTKEGRFLSEGKHRPETLPFARINFNSHPILSKRSSEIMEQGSEVARPDTVSCAAFCDDND